MAKKKETSGKDVDPSGEDQELDMYSARPPRSGIRLQWIVVLAVALAVFTALVAWPRHKAESAPDAATAQAPTAAPEVGEASGDTAAIAPPPAPEEAQAQAQASTDMASASPAPASSAAASAADPESSTPSDAILAEELNPSGPPADEPPPPAEAQALPSTDTSDLGEAEEVPAEVEPEEAPAVVQPKIVAKKPKMAKKAVAKKAVSKKAMPKKLVKAKAPNKKHSLLISLKTTKVPATMQKKRVMAFLSKKLDKDQTCLPASLKKQELKPFTAILTVSKTGLITSVETKPKKMPQAKAIAGCIKRKLGKNPQIFKVKGKSSQKIQVAFKMK